MSIDDSLLKELIYRIKADLQGHIEKIIVFGSHARGEADLDSDLDVMALIRVDNQPLKPFREKLVDIAFDLSLQHDKIFQYCQKMSLSMKNGIRLFLSFKT